MTMGLLTLTRPEYLYLAVVLAIVGAGVAIWRRRLGLHVLAFGKQPQSSPSSPAKAGDPVNTAFKL